VNRAEWLIASQALIFEAHESKLDKQQYRRLVDQRYLFRNSAILDRHDNFNPTGAGHSRTGSCRNPHFRYFTSSGSTAFLTPVLA
jgi:hypothetical protein